MADKEASLLLRIKTAGEEALGKLTFTFGDLVNIAKAVGDALVTPIEEFKQTEAATNSLTRALVNNGIYSAQLKDQYIEQANALAQVSLYEGDQIIAAQANLQQQIGSIKITKELTQAIIDFASAQKMDVSAAAEVVGKSIGTSTNALGRYGIEVNSAANEQTKMAQVIEGLNNKFGGQAEAATQGLGAMEMLHKAVMDIAETLGGMLAPVITQVSQSLLGMTSNNATLDISLQAVAGTFKLLVSMGYAVVEVFDAVGTAIGGVIAAGVESISQLMQGNFSAALDSVKQIGKDTWSEMTIDYKGYQDNINKIWQTNKEQTASQLAEEERMLSESLDRKIELQQTKAMEASEKKLEKDAQDRAFWKELQAAQHEEDMAQLIMDEDQKQLALLASQQKILEANLNHQNQLITNATTKAGKVKAMEDKARMEETLADITHKKNELSRQVEQNKLMEQNRASTLATIASLQNSSNKELAFIGRAAALTQIAIDTPVAIGRALAAFPPPFNYGAAVAVGAAMAAQAARVAGVPLAEGGIVMPRPGGTQAIIGEAGSAEAVIPLDKYPGLLDGGGGQSIQINVYGGLLGDQSSAHEFAKAVDRELLRLRQNNESMAFDSGVV